MRRLETTRSIYCTIRLIYTAMDCVAQLKQAGIHACGSPESQRYEQHLVRYFTREYEQLGDSSSGRLADYGISTCQGPMWQQTEALMSQHYDERPEFFAAFLDRKYMAYSMAWYGATPDEIMASTCTLEQAQRAKFELICARARVRGDEKVFSIGCGFGPLETYLLETYPDIEVTSITPSQVQTDYIQQRMQDPAHPLGCGRLKLIHGDFAAVDSVEHGNAGYDLVFAIGMFEHINNLHCAFRHIAALLSDEGRCFLHLIVSRPLFPQHMDSSNTLIGRYFPGGRIWPFGELQQQADFFDPIDSWYVNGLNYWRTLDEWHRRFWNGMDSLYGQVLSEAAIRHWNDYFILCKTVLFAPLQGSIYGNGHYLFRKKTA
jgi:cyclopropane-fatty-acyl-phospholipid synthase